MFTPGAFGVAMSASEDLPVPRRALFQTLLEDDNAQDFPVLKRPLFSTEEEDSGLGMEVSSQSSTVHEENSPMISSLLSRPFAQFAPSTPLSNNRFSLKRPHIDGCDGSYQKRIKFDQTRRGLKKSLSFGDSPLSNQSHIKDVVGKMVEEGNLIGDGSDTCSLPTIPGKHPDLKSITNNTVADLLLGKYDDEIGSFRLIDCRYPYEFQGGHVKGAINFHKPEDISSILSEHANMQSNDGKRHILIFYCEFSSERGPRMYRNVRKADRNMNSDNYPFLNFPEIYLMHNGYKAFYELHQELCDPTGYTPMLHKDHSDDLRHFRSKSKSWNGGMKRRTESQRLQF